MNTKSMKLFESPLERDNLLEILEIFDVPDIVMIEVSFLTTNFSIVQWVSYLSSYLLVSELNPPEVIRFGKWFLF